MSSRYLLYLRICWGVLFLWLLALGHTRQAWDWVAAPLLALAALLIWADSVERKHPRFAAKLIFAATILITVFSIDVTFRENLPRVYRTLREMVRGEDLAFEQKKRLPLLALREGLSDYLRVREQLEVRELLNEADELNATREAGSFTPDDQEREDELFARVQELAKKDAELRRIQKGLGKSPEIESPRQEPPASQPKSEGHISGSSSAPVSQPDRQNVEKQNVPQPVATGLESEKHVLVNDGSGVVPATREGSHPPEKSEGSTRESSPLQKVFSDDFLLELERCVLRGRNLTCYFRVANDIEFDRDFTLLIAYRNSSRAFDDLGNEYIAKWGQLGSKAGTPGISGHRLTLLPKVPTKAAVEFEGWRSEASLVRILRITFLATKPGRNPFEVRRVPRHADFRDIIPQRR